MIYQIISGLLLLALGLEFYFTRKAMRKLVDSAIVWQNIANKAKRDLGTLTDQYRQLANINKALREVDKVKSLKKK